MSDAVMLERIAVRRAELDVLEEQLVKQLVEVRGERDELVVAERVVQRISEQSFGEYLSLAPAPPEAQVGGRSVLLIPARVGDLDAEGLPQDYQQILAIVREAAGPVKVNEVGEKLGLSVEVHYRRRPCLRRTRLRHALELAHPHPATAEPGPGHQPAARPARPDHPRNQPLTNDLERRHPPANSTRTHKVRHTSTLTSTFKLAASHWRLAIGDWRLAIGDWRLAAGGWRVSFAGRLMLSGELSHRECRPFARAHSLEGIGGVRSSAHDHPRT